MQEHKVYMKVGPVIYKIVAQEPFFIADECKQFFVSSLDDIENFFEKKIIECKIKKVKIFSNIQGELLYQDTERMVFGYQGREQRLHAVNGNVYGIYRELGDDEIEIELDEAQIDALNINIPFLEMLALDRFLLKENALVLHSAFIKWNGWGIVFTAPSGTGKSTQANLWKRQLKAEIINGDRSVIYWNPNSKSFDVCGLPFCGSSRINKNQIVPLRAIIFLTQAPDNKAELYSKINAASKLFGEMSINKWNQDAVEKSLWLIEKIVNQIELVHFACNMELDAVDVLKEYLERKDDLADSLSTC